MAARLSVRGEGWPYRPKSGAEHGPSIHDRGPQRGLLGFGMTGLPSGDTPMKKTGWAVNGDGQARGGSHQERADSDQTASDSDQTAADSDQTTADNDQTAADSDQAAAESDQAASDHDLVHGGDPSVHSLTRDVRDRNSEQRQHGAQRRTDAAAARDVTAHARDVTARKRDQAAEQHDRQLAARDTLAAGDGRVVAGAEILERALEDRKRAAAERLEAADGRARAASDREHAAQDRDQAAHDRSQLREEVELANRAKRTFLSSMSHELRTPLHSVLGFTETLLLGLHGPLAEEQMTHLRTVQNAGRHLLALIDSLLNLARLESEKVGALGEPVDCRRLLEEVAVALRPLAAEKGLELEVLSGLEPIELICDRHGLIRILLNLAENAIDFTDEGTVRIELDRTLSQDGSVTRFTITDTGCGIAPEAQQHLLTAVDRSEPANDTVFDGNGLGLYISTTLAGLLGGRITCDSTQDQGSTFVLEMAESIG
jgi:signal transduction histidine kinase